MGRETRRRSPSRPFGGDVGVPRAWTGRGRSRSEAYGVRLRTVAREAGVVGERLLEPGAGRVVRPRQRRRGREGCREEQGAQGYALSVAPVRLVTSATIRPTAASISASVSVRSRGCRVTVIATDFAPSGRPLP